MMRKSISLLIIIPLIIVSCQKKETKQPEFKITGNIMETYYPDGSLQAKGPIITEEKDGKKVNLKDGDWTYYHKGTKGKAVAAQGKFVKDKYEGTWQMFYPGSAIKSEKTYSDGRLNGVSKEYTETGTLTSEVYYVDNKIAGKKKTFFKDGKIEKEEYYLDGKKNGASTTYYPDGKVQISTTYREDKLNGLYTEYYPDGKKKMEGKYVPIPQSKRDENPNLAAKEGEKTGTWTLYKVGDMEILQFQKAA